ncbi:MAG: hypothetical protein ACK2UA_07575, partial [Anaerolineae bacterium]
MATKASVSRRLRLVRQAAWFVLFLACSLLVFVVLNPYRPLTSGWVDLAGRMAVASAFLLAAILSRRSERARPYWRVWYALATACIAISVDYRLSLSKWILPALRIALESPAGLAIDKLESSALSIL